MVAIVAPISMISIGIIIFLGALYWISKIDLPIKTEKDCKDQDKIKEKCQNDSTCCGVWDGVQCRKGKISNGKCVSQGNPGPIALMSVGGLFILSGLIYFIVSIFI